MRLITTTKALFASRRKFMVLGIGVLRVFLVVMFLGSLSVTAFGQDVVYWTGGAGNGEWDWGGDCNNTSTGGNWNYNTGGARQRPDCYTPNIVHFNNGSFLTMDLNSLFDFSVNQLLFEPGTGDRIINTSVPRSLYFFQSGGNAKIENSAAFTTQTFNVNVNINPGTYMEINPINGYLVFNNTVVNNSSQPIFDWGNQKVIFNGDIQNAAGMYLKQNSTVVLGGSPKTNTGPIMLDDNSTLQISSNQSLANLVLNSTNSTLIVDAGITLTLTGYWYGGGTIINNGTIIIKGPNYFPGIYANVNTMVNLSIDRAGGVTLDKAISVSGTFTLTNGILYNDFLNALTISNTSPLGVSGGSPTSYVNGPLNWMLPPTLAAGNTYIFPVGKSYSYLPIAVIDPTTGAGATSITAEAFTGGPLGGYGGTATGVSLSYLSGSEYWSLQSSGNLINNRVSVTGQTPVDPSFYNSIGRNTTVSGPYYSVGGTISGFSSIINSNNTGGGAIQYFVIAHACIDPDIPTISASVNPAVYGGSTTLSIVAGNLNGAAYWNWYTGSCGGTFIGSGTSIGVTPLSNTTYYVRGEGGCVPPGSCASIDIKIAPSCPADFSVCSNSAVVDLTTLAFPSGGTFFGDGITGNNFDPAIAGAGIHQITYTISNQLIAYWNFNSGSASPSAWNVPIIANQGIGSGIITGGNWTWNNITYTDHFSGSTQNAISPDLAGYSLSLIKGPDASSMNGHYYQVQFTMTGYSNLIISYWTQKSSDKGFINNRWSWSTDNITFTPFGPTIIPLDGGSIITLTAPPDLNGAGTAYLRYTLDGASSGFTSVNNRIDNLQLNASSSSNLPCTFNVTVNPIPVITGTLNTCIGSTTQLTGSGTAAVVNPWISATPAVATVSSSGLVSGFTAGTSVITYTDINGCSNTATVTVNALPTISGTLLVCAGSTTQLTGSGTAAASNPWVSASPLIAAVSTSGLVTGVSTGTSVITYTNNNGCSNTVTVTVNVQPTISGILSACVGASTQLSGSGTAAVSNPWISSNLPVATVSTSGLVNGVGAGSSNITYTIDNGCSRTVAVTINALPTISGNLTVCIGTPSQLTGSGTPAASNPWVSSNPSVATVNSTGLVNGIANGSSIITYTNSNGCSKTATVNINTPPTLTGTLSVCVGLTTQLSGSGTPAATTPWVSGTPTVATVNASGLVTGVLSGTSIITYTNSAGCSATATVSVNAIPTITGTLSVCMGSTTQLTGSGTAAASTPWLSATPGVATVNSTGLVSGVSSGSSVINYTNSFGCQNSATVTVNSLPTATASTSTPIVCAGGTISLTGGPGGYPTYTWDGPNSYHLSSSSVTISENFNGIGTSGTATLPAGFKIGPDYASGTSVTTLAYGTTGTGVVNGTSTGGTINWANGITSSSTDRSIGFLTSGSYSSPRSIIYAFTNNTGSTLSTIDLAWNYEKYRSGSRQFDWTFFHGNTSTAIIPATTGDKSYPADASNTVISNPPLLSAKSFQITGLSIPNGSIYYLRWTYTGLAGSTNAQGLGIDDILLTFSTGNAQSPSITNATTAMSGAYILTVTDANGCTATASTAVTVNAAPTVTAPASVCVGGTANLTPATGGTWVSNDITKATVTNAGVITGVAPGSGVTFTFTETASGCTNTTAAVTVLASPTVATGSNSPLCVDNTLNLYSFALSATSYNWTGPSFSSSVQNPTISNVTISSSGNYTVVATNSGNGCTASATVSIAVNPLPVTVSTTSNTPVCTGNTIQLTSGAPGMASYKWTGPSSYTNAVALSPNVTQNFDGLAALGTGIVWIDGFTITDWYSQRSGTGSGTYDASDGSSGTGKLYSFGTGTASDRALGTVGSGTPGNLAHGFIYHNISGHAITDIKVTYTLEQWRDGGTFTGLTPSLAQSISAWYQINASAVTALSPGAYGGWKMEPGLTLTGPKFGLTAGTALDGNNSANRVTATNVPLQGAVLTNNQYLLIKWEDINHPDNDHAFGIDDVTISFTYADIQNPTIPNATAAANAGTYTLIITDANGCSNTATTTVTIGNQWKGITDSKWDVATNWSCLVPGSTTDVIIPSGVPNNPEVNITGAVCNNLTINSSGSLTIDAGKDLTVNGNVSNTGNFTISSDALNNNGSLIVNGIASTGNVIYNRYLTPAPASPDPLRRWFIVSSPVNTSAGGFDGSAIIHNGTADYDLAPYIEPENEGWKYYTEGNLPTSLSNGKGYVARVNGSGILKFTGPLNNADVSVPVTNTATISSGLFDNGWNAIGNPFTSAIGITDLAGTDANFLNVNSGIFETNYSAIYLWYQTDITETGTGSYSGTEQYYRVMNNNGYLPAGKAYGGPISDKLIQAGQGFLINVKNSGNVVFTKATAANSGMQIHSPAITMKSSETSWPGLTLVASNKGRTRSTIVAFNSTMTTGLDPSYDAGLLATSDFNLYTHLLAGDNETDFTIQCLPENIYDSVCVPVGIDIPEAGKITLRAEGVILPDGLYPVLEDRLLHQSTALKTETDSVTVEMQEPSRGIGRFYLHIGGVCTVGNAKLPETRKLTARFTNHKITIFGSPEQGSRAWLYDISGRRLGGEYRLTPANQNEIAAPGLSDGIYLLRIEGKTQRQTLKITILNR